MTIAMQLTLEDLAQSPAPIREPAHYLGSMGAMCHLTDVLCWERWGYWSEWGGPPAWASETLTAAKKAASLAKPTDCRYSLELTANGAKVSGTFRVWDEANSWAKPWSVNFTGYSSEESARQHYARDFDNHKHRQEDAVRVLIHYRDNGELPPDGGKPEGQRYWLKSDYRPERRVHLKENQPGVICYERFENPAYPHSRGMIRVEVEPHRVDEWMVDCYAERPDKDRKVCAAHLHAKTYDAARKLGEEWIEKVGRPHVVIHTD